MKSDFVNNITHEFQTPLATMANLCDEALDEFRADLIIAAGDRRPERRAERIAAGAKADHRLDRVFENAVQRGVARTMVKYEDKMVLLSSLMRHRLAGYSASAHRRPALPCPCA